MGKQPRPGAPTRNRMRGRRRLGDGLAGPAGELLPHVLDHLPLARHDLQRLGHVLADLAQGAAAARTGRRRRIDNPLTRQVVGKRPARWLAPFKALDLDRVGARRRACYLCRRLGFGRVLLEIGKLELKLLDQCAPLRGLTEPFMAQLGDGELQLLDHQRLRLRCRLGSRARRPLGQQHRLQRRDIIRQRIIGAHHLDGITRRRSCVNLRLGGDSQCRDQPAACGRQVCCGMRQSMPSRR